MLTELVMAAVVHSSSLPTVADNRAQWSARRRDWRNGAVVYQVFVDRFVPPADAATKAGRYPAPLKPWTELPKARFDAATNSYPHVYDFWGGDLAGVQSKLDYVRGLGVDVLYLNPIFTSPTNHKYDTTDYFEIDPQYGTAADFRRLLDATHGAGMKLMLDGVFNHVGDQNRLFTEARRDPKSARRDWFFFDSPTSDRYRGWAGVTTMPGIRLENAAARRYFWGGKESVVNRYLADGVDGWRLDVAFELGPKFLRELTESAHRTRPGSAVVGEISGYPAEWAGSVDGVFNFHSINMAIEMLNGNVSGGRFGQMQADLVEDAGIEFLLQSWLITDNHDTPRFASVVKDAETRHLVRLLQFTLPGSPCLYYGSELGLAGAGDPECRAPMPWERVRDDTRDLVSLRQLSGIRRKLPALRIGDYRRLATDRLLAFARTTDRLEETVFVAVNPTSETVTETVASRVGRVMSWGELRNVVTGEKIRSITGMITLKLPPRSAAIYVPSVDPFGGYSPYQRILDTDGE
ncbi:MAG: glycoside hydrolase family 13 protein [Fimbriimonadaceae bacterium]|nr:glycoside hydrolase family 13 protein [Fimbriimonadaceae bacterium]